MILMMAFTLNVCSYNILVEDEISYDNQPMSFTGDIIPIFNSSCNTSGCHNGSVAPNLTSGNAYSALTTGGYLNTSNPESSELYQWMKGNRSTVMPLSGANPTYNAKVLAWIKQGALNN